MSDDVTAWAGKARAFERDFVLWKLWMAATPIEPGEVTANIPTGWGRVRLLHWRGSPHGEDALKAAAITVLVIDEPVGPFLAAASGVVHRAGGGPVVQRAEDLTLSWLPAGTTDAVTLVLHQRLRITRAHTAIPVSA